MTTDKQPPEKWNSLQLSIMRWLLVLAGAGLLFAICQIILFIVLAIRALNQ